MIVMYVKLKNICAFDDFHANFSYPKKIVNSSIEREYLPGFPNFRYKKVNILLGTNASGKTSFGKILMYIFNFMKRKELLNITDRISDNKKESVFSIDYISDKNTLSSLEVIIPPEEEEYSIERCQISLKRVNIKKGDSYEKCVERMKNGKEVEAFEGLEALEKVSKSSGLGWNFTYPMDSNYYIRDIKVDDLENELYLKVLKNVLMTLDNSIVDIKKVDSIEHTYAIVMNNNNLIIQEGKVLDPNNILSSGTKAGIEISGFLTALMEHRNGFYYCDEKFSYIHSDIEKAILSVMISKLGSGEQMFFTTHNLDITDMDLPKHSFLFMRKENIGGEFIISCESVSNRLKKATDSVRNAVDNDIFAVAPRIELIYDLAYEDDIDDVLDEDAG